MFENIFDIFQCYDIVMKNIKGEKLPSWDEQYTDSITICREMSVAK
jgi:hypothetical protein